VPAHVTIIRSKAEYNEACMAWMATSHMHITLNHIEELEDESKEDIPVDIYMDNRSAVDMIINFKEAKNARHIRCRSHFVKKKLALVLYFYARSTHLSLLFLAVNIKCNK
jgi:hypothetical protein